MSILDFWSKTTVHFSIEQKWYKTRSCGKKKQHREEHDYNFTKCGCSKLLFFYSDRKSDCFFSCINVIAKQRKTLVLILNIENHKQLIYFPKQSPSLNRATTLINRALRIKRDWSLPMWGELSCRKNLDLLCCDHRLEAWESPQLMSVRLHSLASG